MLHQCLKGECVAESFEAHNLPDATGSSEAFMTNLFARMSIAQVHFDSGHHVGHRFDGVGHTQTGMRQRSGIDDDSVERITGCPNASDEIALGITLNKFQFHFAEGFGAGRQIRRNGVEGFGPIDIRLAGAEQVEIRAVQNKYFE